MAKIRERNEMKGFTTTVSTAAATEQVCKFGWLVANGWLTGWFVVHSLFGHRRNHVFEWVEGPFLKPEFNLERPPHLEVDEKCCVRTLITLLTQCFLR
jgi:hypothetical protein